MAPILHLLGFLALFLIHVDALKFEIQAHPGHESANKERCIRNFAARDTLVVVTATVSGAKGDGQMLNLHVCEVFPLNTNHKIHKTMSIFGLETDSMAMLCRSKMP